MLLLNIDKNVKERFFFFHPLEERKRTNQGLQQTLNSSAEAKYKRNFRSEQRRKEKVSFC
jgi:hypothetical protein